LIHLDGRIAVALNDGFSPLTASPFAPTLVATAPAEITSAAAGDLDGDGDQDLVYVTETTLGRMLGNGDGMFVAGSEIDSSGGVVALGDFDADGKLDAVAANTDARIASTFTLHFGNGSGGFTAAVVTSIPEEAIAVITAKFDGDTMDDIAIVSPEATRIFLPRAGRTLQSAASLAGGASLVSGRFDADSLTDLAIVHLVDRDASLYVYGGNGNGTFTQRATYPLPEDGPIACADVDGDGLNDLLTTSAVTSFFRGLGNGSFAAPLFSPIASDPEFALADFDRDGEQDLVAIQPNPAFIELVRGHGDGTFGIDPMYVAHTPPLLDDEAPGATADMNGDLRPDVILLVEGPGLTRSIAVMRNNGSGALLAPTLTASGMTMNEPAHLVAGRVNGDAYPDVVVIGTEGGVERATVFLGSADGTLTRGTSIAAVFPDAAPTPRLIDVTNDGVLDLLIDWSVYPGNGSGGFGAELVRNLTFHVVADFDGDGARDVIGVEDVDAPRLAIATNTDGGTFSAPMFFGLGGGEIPYAAGDFNGDGKLDLFCMTETATRVYPGQGDATFGVPVEVDVPLFADEHEVTTADFDGDGKLDVSFSSALLLGNGDGRFRVLEIGSPGFEASGVADFDGNGTPDLCSYGDLVTLHLTRLVPEPLHDSTASLTTPDDVTYPAPSTSTARVAGTLVPPTGSILYTVDGVPVAIRILQGAAATSPETASAAIFTRSLPAGQHTLAVAYPGDAYYRPSAATDPLFVYDAAGVEIRLTATANGTSVAVSWTPRSGATGYVVYRKSTWAGAWVAIQTTSGFNASETVPAGTTRMYAVAPIIGGTIRARSTPDIATTVAFTDPATVSVPGMHIKAAHLTELRTAVNAVRTFAGLAPYAYAGTIATGGVVRGQHVAQLRTALSQARSTIAMPMTLSAFGPVVKAVHVEELRAGVR
jgi:hypothetical protein